MLKHLFAATTDQAANGKSAKGSVFLFLSLLDPVRKGIKAILDPVIDHP